MEQDTLSRIIKNRHWKERKRQSKRVEGADRKRSAGVISSWEYFLGTLHNQKLLYLDDADVTDFVEKMLTYALIRDVFREMKSGN